MRGNLKEELAKYELCLPIMTCLSELLQSQGKVSAKVIGWHCHLTEITAAAAEVLLKSGAKLFMSECNPDTTNLPAVEYMRSLGAEIYLGADSCAKVLAAKPAIVSDTGLVLTRAYEQMRRGEKYVYAGSEITTSGITALSEIDQVSLPVIDINSGQLKSYIENFHGVGDGLVDLLAQLTGRMWAGHTVAVLGYGKVGSGVARYLRRIGANLFVVDSDPVRALIAHYDGYPVVSLDDALTKSTLIITATGQRQLIGDREWKSARDGTVFVNVGHWSTELDVESLHQISSACREVGPHLKEFSLPYGKRLYLIADGNPANVVVLSGSPEPTLIHLTTEILCMNYLLGLQESGAVLPPGAQALPAEVERTAAELALRALNLSN